MTTPFDPVPRTPATISVKVDNQEVAVGLDAPGALEPVIPPPIWMTIVMRSVVVLMVVLFGMMIFMGLRQFNPMMMGSMLMMFGMLGGGMMGVGAYAGKNQSGELHVNRSQYATHFCEQRRNAHLINRHIHTLQTSLYPHPDTLGSRCGKPTAMWTTVPPTNTTSIAGGGRERAERAHINGWGCARIGVGYRRTEPYIKPTATLAPETYEPVQAAMYMRFIRTQNVITNCPIGIDLFARPFVVCAGDQDRLVETARAMICSLACNHAPKHLQLGIITEELDLWDWMKWLPHCKDLTRRDLIGPARLHWPTIGVYAADQRAVIDSRAAHTGASPDGGPYRVIFVDTPGKSADIPPGITADGLAGHTFVYLRHS